MKKFAVLVSFLIATMQLLTSQTMSQVVGSRENNAPSPKEIKPSTLTAGGFTSDVSLFTGTLNTSYSLGSVSTPSGLNFELKANYSSSLTGGDNTSATSGIPYGEGWNLNIPTVSVQYETFRNYTPEEIQHCQLYHTPFSNCPVQNHPPIATKDVYYNPERAHNEGGSYYLNVQVNIPGVASERFNYVYEENNMAYFIPHTFEKFLEAKFNGQVWEVTAANGDYYVFNYLQYSQRSPSNQRVFYNNDQQLPYLSEMPEIIMNLVLPKWEISRWYCSYFTNPNHPAGQKIVFQYEHYGAFDFHKELNEQSTLNTTAAAELTGQLGVGTATFDDYVAYKDVLLKKVIAIVNWDVDYQTLELNYGTVFLEQII